jgi:hypothetical protein
MRYPNGKPTSRRNTNVQATIQLPKAFSVRDEHKIHPIGHLLARLNPNLVVAQVATGKHVNGGCTVLWGVTFLKNRAPAKALVEAALKEAGFDFSHAGSVELSNLAAGRAEG